MMILKIDRRIGKDEFWDIFNKWVEEYPRIKKKSVKDEKVRRNVKTEEELEESRKTTLQNYYKKNKKERLRNSLNYYYKNREKILEKRKMERSLKPKKKMGRPTKGLTDDMKEYQRLYYLKKNIEKKKKNI